MDDYKEFLTCVWHSHKACINTVIKFSDFILLVKEKPQLSLYDLQYGKYNWIDTTIHLPTHTYTQRTCTLHSHTSLFILDSGLVSATRSPIICILNVAASAYKRGFVVMSSYHISGYCMGNHSRHKALTCRRVCR